MLKEKLNSAFAFLQTKSPPLIGVDISSSALKLVELSEVGKGAYRLERYVIEPLPRDVVSDGNIANLDQVTEALRRGYKRLGTRNRNIAMALPTAMVITKKIIVPSGQTEEELELVQIHDVPDASRMEISVKPLALRRSQVRDHFVYELSP